MHTHIALHVVQDSVKVALILLECLGFSENGFPLYANHEMLIFASLGYASLVRGKC